MKRLKKKRRTSFRTAAQSGVLEPAGRMGILGAHHWGTDATAGSTRPQAVP
jgi:hypothetical protein